MTAYQRLLGVRRTLVAAIAARAALAGVAVALALLVGVRIAGVGAAGTGASIAAGFAVAILMLAPLRRARSLQRVALWVEERHPGLRYAVVTIADGTTSPALEAQALALPWWSSGPRRMARALAWPLLAALAALALLVAAPGVMRARSPALHGGGDDAVATRARAADPLAVLRATVVPPAYSGRPTVTLDEPSGVEALVSSVVTVSGEGDGGTIVATLDSATRPVRTVDGRWSVSLAMPSRPALLRLRRRDTGGRERLVVLAPVIDAAPGVTLILPARDTVVRAASGLLLLRATLRDDIGLRDARFELVVSSGQDENFTFRTTVVGNTRFGNATERTIEGRLSLDSLALKPGDVLQLRAVARDANTATGPGVGSSETRSLRVARAGEYDSLNVDPAPPGEPEGQVLSQRMLIMLTEALERRRRRLPRAILLDESGRIAADQARLRKRVGDVVFQRLGGEPLSEETGGVASGGKVSPDELLKRAEQATHGTVGEVMDVEGDETPILAVNKPLLEAFNAMWDAGRALEQGETDRALPPMRRALAAIERARQAERIYLRGRPSAVVVDVVKARLAGKDKGASTVREPRAPVDPVPRRRAASFAHATALLSRDASAAADTLLVMRVDALESAPALAAALDDASRAIRRGDAAAIGLAWQRVRRALGPAPVRGDALGLWGGAP
jgi:hypothetical protein